MRTNTRKRNQRVAQRKSTMKRGGAKRSNTMRNKTMKRGGARKIIRTNKRSRVMRKNRVNKRSLSRKTMKKGGARRGSRKTMKAQRGGASRIARGFRRFFRSGRTGEIDLVEFRGDHDDAIDQMINDGMKELKKLRETAVQPEGASGTKVVQAEGVSSTDNEVNAAATEAPDVEAITENLPKLVEKLDNVKTYVKISIEQQLNSKEAVINFLEEQLGITQENAATNIGQMSRSMSEEPSSPEKIKMGERRRASNTNLLTMPSKEKMEKLSEALKTVIEAGKGDVSDKTAAIEIMKTASDFTEQLGLIEKLNAPPPPPIETDEVEKIKNIVKILYVSNAMMDYMNAKKYGIFTNLTIQGLANLVNICLPDEKQLAEPVIINYLSPGIEGFIIREYDAEMKARLAQGDGEDLGPAQSLVLSAVFDKLYNDLLPDTDEEDPYVTMINPATVAGKFKIAITEDEAKKVADEAAEAERAAQAAAAAAAGGVASGVPPPRPLRPREIKIVNDIPDGHEEIKPTEQEAIIIGDTQQANGVLNLHLIDLGPPTANV